MNFFRKIIKNQKGQSMLELLMVSPLYFLVLMGIWWFGQWFITDVTIENISRAAAWEPVYDDDADASSMESKANDLAQEWLGKYIDNEQVEIVEVETGEGNGMVFGGFTIMQLLVDLQIRMEPMLAMLDMDVSPLGPNYAHCRMTYKYKVWDFFTEGMGWMGVSGPEWEEEWMGDGENELGAENYVANSTWMNRMAIHMLPIDTFMPIYWTDTNEHP
ncbi:MAG: TadE/TadG family type IV pilus assembly protein [Elusimicrobiota bacterium]